MAGKSQQKTVADENQKNKELSKLINSNSDDMIKGQLNGEIPIDQNGLHNGKSEVPVVQVSDQTEKTISANDNGIDEVDNKTRRESRTRRESASKKESASKRESVSSRTSRKESVSDDKHLPEGSQSTNSITVASEELPSEINFNGAQSPDVVSTDDVKLDMGQKKLSLSSSYESCGDEQPSARSMPDLKGDSIEEAIEIDKQDSVSLGAAPKEQPKESKSKRKLIYNRSEEITRSSESPNRISQIRSHVTEEPDISSDETTRRAEARARRAEIRSRRTEEPTVGPDEAAIKAEARVRRSEARARKFEETSRGSDSTQRSEDLAPVTDEATRRAEARARRAEARRSEAALGSEGSSRSSEVRSRRSEEPASGPDETTLRAEARARRAEARARRSEEPPRGSVETAHTETPERRSEIRPLRNDDDSTPRSEESTRLTNVLSRRSLNRRTDEGAEDSTRIRRMKFV